MKKYEKQYEDVFSCEDALKKCDISRITTDVGWSAQEYGDCLRKTLRESLGQLFDTVVKLHWLQRRFFYGGLQRKKAGCNFYLVDNAFATYTRYYLGVSHRLLVSTYAYSTLSSYFPDFFPDFDKGNPMTEPEKYAFPYKNITPDFLSVVYQMSERLELLQEAEEQKMPYAKFLDYVINYVSCYSEEHPNVYYFVHAPHDIPHVRSNKKKKKK